MATNDFLAFGTDAGANVETQAEYTADPNKGPGFATGVAASAKVNKVLRQAAFMASVIGQLIVNTLDEDCLDDGDLNGKVALLLAALQEIATPGAGSITDAMLASGVTGGGTIAKAISPSFTGNALFVQITASNTISDALGNLREIPQNIQALAYTLVATDSGKQVVASAQVTVPSAVFAAKQVIQIINNTDAAITIVQGAGLTMHQGGQTATGNRTLAARGVCCVLFTSNAECYICGAGVS